MSTNYDLHTRGPFRAEYLHDKDPYELSNGHAIQCMPSGRDHSNSNITGATAISTDPDVQWCRC